MTDILPAPVIAAYRRDGVVCLRGAFDSGWMDVVRLGFERNLAHPGRRATVYPTGADAFVGREDIRNFVSDPFVPGGSPEPRFYNDCTTWQDNPEYRRFVYDSPAAAIARTLMGSRKVNIFFEDIIIKEPHADAPTPWHQDVPFWPVRGAQVCGIWIPLDPITRENRIDFIAGTHHWGKAFLPMDMVDPEAHYGVDLAPYTPTPDFDAGPADYKILTWELEPGDCLVFDGHVIHGAPANPVDRLRRVFATRWTGDDCVYAGDKHKQLGPPFPRCGIAPGAPMDSKTFPVILPRPGDSET